MDFIDWRLLVVLAVFVAGWLVARVDMEQVVSRARAIPDRALRGIARLLKNDRHGAAQDFLAAAEPLLTGNVELHFTAGELERQRGDNEAAIRIHKRIQAEPSLTAEIRARARYELGLDYQQGGFLDLAAECFSQLEGTAHADASLHNLLNIHVYSRDWQKAIEHEERFARQDGNSELRRHVIAQFYCEWAAQEPPSRRAELLAEALRRNPACGRAHLMQAELAVENDAAAEALKALDKLRGQPALMAMAAGLLMQASRLAGTRADGARLLLEEFERAPSVMLFERVYDALAADGDSEELAALAAQGLRLLRGPVPVVKWLQSQRDGATGADAQRSDEMIRALGDERAQYRCTSCSFATASHSWQCPLCRNWETMAASQRQA